MADQFLSRSLLLSLLLSLPPALPALAIQPDDQGYCCLPLKWHSHVVKTNEKLLTFLPNGPVETETARPLQLDIYVNHRRPRFELRTPGGSSVVFWRGYMWIFGSGAAHPRLLNAVPHGFRPSGGFAPLFFRCLATRNGFDRLNETHYRMTEPDSSPVGLRFGLATVTDVHVVPEPRRPANHTCHLREFSVTSTYLKPVPGRGPALVRDVDSYTAASQPRTGWPDHSLTERARAFRSYYRSLLRSGRVQSNRPNLAVPVVVDRKIELY